MYQMLGTNDQISIHHQNRYEICTVNSMCSISWEFGICEFVQFTSFRSIWRFGIFRIYFGFKIANIQSIIYAVY